MQCDSIYIKVKSYGKLKLCFIQRYIHTWENDKEKQGNDKPPNPRQWFPQEERDTKSL